METKGVLFQGSFPTADTIYRITQVHDFENADILIPANCVLKFEGGLFKNFNSLTFNNTYIENSTSGNGYVPAANNPDRFFLKECTIIDGRNQLKGTLRNEEVNILWFGANRNNINGSAEGNTQIFNNVIELCKNGDLRYSTTRIRIPNGIYHCKTIYLKNGVILRGDSKEITILSYKGEKNGDILTTQQYDDAEMPKEQKHCIHALQISDLKLDGNYTGNEPEGLSPAKRGLNVSYIRESTFKNLVIVNVTDTAIYADSSNHGNFKSGVIYNHFEQIVTWNPNSIPCEYGIRLMDATNSNYFYNCRISNAKTGIAVESDVNVVGAGSNNNMFVGCSVEPSHERAIYLNAEGNTFVSPRIEGYKVGIEFDNKSKRGKNVILNPLFYGKSNHAEAETIKNRNDGNVILGQNIDLGTHNAKWMFPKADFTSITSGSVASPHLESTDKEGDSISYFDLTKKNTGTKILRFGKRENNGSLDTIFQLICRTNSNGSETFIFQTYADYMANREDYDRNPGTVQPVYGKIFCEAFGIGRKKNPVLKIGYGLRLPAFDRMPDKYFFEDCDIQNDTAFNGLTIFDSVNNVPVFNKNGTWYRADGFRHGKYTGYREYTYFKRKGALSDKPTLEAQDAGFQYYDSAKGRMILWNGSKWVNIDGSELKN